MLDAYKHDLTESLLVRREKPSLRAAKLITPAVLVTGCYIGVCLLVLPEGREADYHFVSERGLITAMSATLLAASAAFCLCALGIRHRTQRVDQKLLILMMVGFLFLALDEVAQFHERLGPLLPDVGYLGSFRNGNDIVVVLYGIVSLPIAAVVLPHLLRFRMMPECLAVAFGFYLIHTVIDVTQDPRTTMSVIFEESSKLFCGTFMALGAYMGFADILESSADD
jgi:hypothetical protein